jgi:hypothetical protein
MLGPDADVLIVPVSSLHDVLEEGGFATAVGSDQRHGITSGDVHIGFVEQVDVVETTSVFAYLKGDVGPRLLGYELCIHRGLVKLRFLDGVLLLSLKLGAPGPEPLAPCLTIVNFGDFGESTDRFFQLRQPFLVGDIVRLLGQKIAEFG